MATQEHFLAEIVEKYGMKVTELAKRAHISKQSLTGFLKNRHGISDEKLIKVANVLGVRPEDIIPGRYANNSVEGQKYLIKSIKMTDKYYNDKGFGENQMIDIATELYNFLITVDRVNDKQSLDELKKDMNKKLNQGLAAKCLLDFLDKQ